VLEEHDMGGVLARHCLADGAMAGVIVDRFIVGMGMDMRAAAGICV
jgi:hypothetical protein